MVTAIVGANWGDEGKGKITDLLAEQSDVVIRFQGGANAGHTIINDYGKFALHQLPSGIFNKNVVNVIGNGVALDVSKLCAEIRTVKERGIDFNLMISDRCQLLMSYHVLFDKLEEERLKGKSFGSTKSGIAPFYSDKYAKTGIQISELFSSDLREKVEGILAVKNVLLENLYHHVPISVDEIMSELEEVKSLVADYVCDTAKFVREQSRLGKKILLEGQLGALKDPDMGIYPCVTSSSTLAGYGSVGAGVAPYEIKRVIAVTKAYSSAVGAGEFVSEIFGEEANELRKRGGDAGEYGATTGRPRRMGWFDAVASRYGAQAQNATDVALTAIDVLGYLDKIPVCVGYEINGVVTKDFPTTSLLKIAKPVYKYLDGWKCDVKGTTEYDKLPENARKYVEFVEKEIGLPIKIVSTGPSRKAIIYR